MTNRIEGKIAAILDKTTIVINRGLEHGVVQNDIFYIYTRIGPFIDPETKDDLGEATRIWGKVQVTIVEEKFCIAKTQYTNPLLLSLPANLFTNTRIQLPVSDHDITKHVERVEVGFPVISEREIKYMNILVDSESRGKIKLLTDHELQQVVEDLVDSLASELINTNEQIISKLAETNALGYATDFYEITSSEFDDTKREISFKAKIDFSGEQDENKPFCGDRLEVEVGGIINTIDDNWSIESYEILSANVN